MGKMPFTKEQQELLAANPFTLSVNDYQIRFTVDFKRFLLGERKKNHTPWKEVFRKAGYDPELLGKTRMDSIIHKVRKEAASEKGLRETAKKKKDPKSQERQQMKTAIRDLQQEVEQLRQQVEFLKKTQIILQSETTEDPFSML
jgi:hypothetical protein